MGAIVHSKALSRAVHKLMVIDNLGMNNWQTHADFSNTVHYSNDGELNEILFANSPHASCWPHWLEATIDNRGSWRRSGPILRVVITVEILFQKSGGGAKESWQLLSMGIQTGKAFLMIEAGLRGSIPPLFFNSFPEAAAPSPPPAQLLQFAPRLSSDWKIHTMQSTAGMNCYQATREDVGVSMLWVFNIFASTPSKQTRVLTQLDWS